MAIAPILSIICSFLDVEQYEDCLKILESDYGDSSYLQDYINKNTIKGDLGYMIHGKSHSINDIPSVSTSYVNYWHKFGVLHRGNDLPAIENSNGNKYWYVHGVMHRDNDLPSIELANGTKQWYKKGQLHRDNDLPAVIYEDGTKYWYNRGLIHRDNNLPAIAESNGTKHWYILGVHCVTKMNINLI